MANENNVALLASHLGYALALNPKQPAESQTDWCRRLAEWLIETSPSVLVPAALTDDELLACEVDQETRESPMERAEVARAVRDRLERFARGER